MSQKGQNMKFSVCIDAVFGGDFARGVPAAKRAGAAAVECWKLGDRDPQKVMEQLDGLPLAAFCTTFFDLTDPNSRQTYLEHLGKALETAKLLDCRRLITQVGNDTGAPREKQHESIVEGLRAAAPMLEAAGVTLLVEPLNLTVNHPGYYLSSSAEAFAMIDEVGSPNIKVLFDIYHQQITEGDILRHLLPNLEKVGHLHAAGSRGRHELSDGELNYPYIFAALDEAGYDGYCGLEYFPQEAPEKGLREAIQK